MSEIGGGANPGLIICSQEGRFRLKDHYYLLANPTNDTLSLYLQEAGGSSLVEHFERYADYLDIGLLIEDAAELDDEYSRISEI